MSEISGSGSESEAWWFSESKWSTMSVREISSGRVSVLQSSPFRVILAAGNR